MWPAYLQQATGLTLQLKGS